MKKMFWFVVLAVSVLGATGCSTVQKKFTRKPKGPAHQAAAVYLQEEGPYQKKYSNEYYYKTHFTFWNSFHQDMLEDLDGNEKKLRRSAEEAWNHLTSMGEYLNEEKRAQLEPLKDNFNKIYQRIERGNFSKNEVPLFRSELEKIGRIIAANFYYDKVKESLVPDKVDLGS